MNTMRTLPNQFQREKGLVLLISLVMLVVMTMMGIAMYRQVGMGFAIAGNLAFKQGASIASDRGIEGARAWLIDPGFLGFNNPQLFTQPDNPATTGVDESLTPAYAYYSGWCHTSASGVSPNAAGADALGVTNCANSVANFDPLTYNWANAGVATWDDGAGNEVRFVIHRMCQIDGSLDGVGQQCVTLAMQKPCGNQIGEPCLQDSRVPYFRITTRTIGTRNSLVYTQAVMY